MKKMHRKKSIKAESSDKPVISRGKAIKQLGQITLSAATMMLLLNETAKAQDSEDSPDIPPEWE